MRFPRATALFVILLGGCAVAPPGPLSSAPSGPSAFSRAVPGDSMPDGWIPYRLMRLKKLTQYRLVRDGDRVVVQAQAEASASGLRHPVRVDPRDTPWLEWSWKVSRNIEGARNSETHIEDAAARVIVFFEGGREDLPPDEQINYDLALAMTGNHMPYATLMYVWESSLTPGQVITHHATSRVKMIVAGAHDRPSGEWRTERHNLLEDYRRAFGADPPPVVSVGIMSDSDNTNSHVVAYYGDIRFRRE